MEQVSFRVESVGFPNPNPSPNPNPNPESTPDAALRWSRKLRVLVAVDYVQLMYTSTQWADQKWATLYAQGLAWLRVRVRVRARARVRNRFRFRVRFGAAWTGHRQQAWVFFPMGYGVVRGRARGQGRSWAPPRASEGCAGSTRRCPSPAPPAESRTPSQSASSPIASPPTPPHHPMHTPCVLSTSVARDAQDTRVWTIHALTTRCRPRHVSG